MANVNPTRYKVVNLIKSLLFILSFFLSGKVLSQPVITSFSPASGAVGSSVVISGSNFSSTASNNIVFFGAVKAVVTVASANSLTVTVPAGSNNKPITVTTNNLTAYSSKPFLVTFTGPGVGASLNGYAFLQSGEFATDLLPHGIAAVDLDGDGKPDIVTPNDYSVSGQPASLSVLRNMSTTGAISFAPKQDIINGVLTAAVASGDFNGDGKPDIVVSSISDQNISVLKNTSVSGSISFAPKINIASGTNPESIAVRDFDGDGKPDIAVANYISGTIALYKNTSSVATISFAAAVPFTSSPGSSSIAVADMDGDGKCDIIVSSSLASIVSVFRNTSSVGTISFAPKVDIASVSTIQSVAVGDLDGDGKPDMAVAEGDKLGFWRNTSSAGSISFGSRTDYDGSADAPTVVIGDMNGDAKPDILLAGSFSATYRNQSSPGAITLDFANDPGNGYGTLYADIIDIDGDSKPDIVNAVTNFSRISVCRNRLNEPVVSSYTPNPAGQGATVTISGLNFTGTTGVTFGDMPAASFVVVNSTTISAVVGTGFSGDVKVTTPYGTGTRAGFSFAGIPVIDNFTPTGASTGQTVTINGHNLGSVTAVKFGGVPASSYSNISPTQITAVVAEGATGNIDVTTQFGTGTATGFLYTPIPAITYLNPFTAAQGTTVEIHGTNFVGVTGIKFGGVPVASFTVQSSSLILAVVGNGATGDVVVTNNNGSGTLTNGFVYIPPPTITSFTPTSGIPGTVITVTGTNFVNVTDVKVGGMSYSQSFSIISETELVVTLNNQGATGDVSVTTNGGTASKPGFTFYRKPTYGSITPNMANTGMTVSITGTDFTGISAVTLGGVPVSSYTVVSPTLITAIVGAGASGAVAITNPAGTGSANSYFLFGGWPIITNCSPLSGPVGTTVTIKGGGFNTTAANNAVYFGTVKATIISATANTLTVKVPYGASSKGISVTNITSQGTGYNDKGFNITFPGDAAAFNGNSFGGPVNFASGPAPFRVVTGDIDGDGKLDMVVTYSNQSYISIYRNTSTSTLISFAARVDIPVNAGLKYLVLADFDNDGKLDIAGTILDYNGNGFTTIRNTSTTGNISFAAYNFVNAFANFYLLAAGDLDKDGKIDLVGGCINCIAVSGSTNYLEMKVVMNTSTPGNIVLTFNYNMSVPIGSGSASDFLFNNIFVKDLDNDNKPDVVFGTTGDGFVIFKNTSGISSSNTTFVNFQGSVFGTTTHQIPRSNAAIADFDNDGIPDIITTSHYYHGLGNFGFGEYNNPNGPVADISDINGDGLPDFVKITGGASSPLYVVKDTSTTGNMGFAAAVGYPAGANYSFSQAADMDGDGKPDLIYTNADLNTVSILKNKVGIANVCPGGTVTLSSSITTGSSFQWQQNTGSGFVNISNNANFSGTNTAMLQISNVPAAWYGYQYRCVVDGNNSDAYEIHFTNNWTGAVSTAWENPANWSCGSIPDANTNVVIVSGTIIIHSNVVIHSLNINPSVSLTVGTGYTLTVTH